MLEGLGDLSRQAEHHGKLAGDEPAFGGQRVIGDLAGRRYRGPGARLPVDRPTIMAATGATRGGAKSGSMQRGKSSELHGPERWRGSLWRLALARYLRLCWRSWCRPKGYNFYAYFM